MKEDDDLKQENRTEIVEDQAWAAKEARKSAAAAAAAAAQQAAAAAIAAAQQAAAAAAAAAQQAAAAAAPTPSPAPPASPSPATPAPERPKIDLPPGWEKSFTGGRNLDSIQVEIESSTPRPSRPASGPPVSGEAQAGSDPTATPKPIAASQPAVYELNLDGMMDMMDSAGNVDWARAMGSNRPRTGGTPATPAASPGQSATRAGTPRPSSLPPAASSPATPSATPSPGFDWTKLPGAEKVLRRSPESPGVAAPLPTAEGSPAPPPPSAARPAGERRPLPPGSPDPPTTPIGGALLPEEPMSRYEQLKRQPSFQIDPEAAKTANEFSQIMFHISRAMGLLKQFKSDYAYLIAPNVFAVWEDNLKECTSTMLREFQNMKDPRKKQYDKKFVCRSCHMVFFVSLPDGICDECRGKLGPTQGPY